MKQLRGALAVVFVMLMASAAAAQTGGLKVKVTDDENLPLPGATVQIQNELGYVKDAAEVTNARGEANFPVLRPGGGYIIIVSFPGFSPIRQDGLRVRISDVTDVPVQMIAELEERVKVTAQRQVIDLDKSESSTKFNDDFIQDLPVAGRQYQSVLTLAPGVNDPDGDGNPTVHGSRSRDFQTSVSGVSNTDPLTGRWMSRVNPNSIEEMEVITAGAGVEFGRAQGGFATIIQKQGSNEHEGVFEYYLRTSALDKDGAGDRSALPDADFETNQPLFQLSGPILRDKLWYRFSHEFNSREDPIALSGGTEIVTTDQDTHSDQITWQISPRNKLAFLYQSDPLTVTNAGVSQTTPSSAAFAFDRTGENLSMTWDAPYSPKVFVQSTAAWQDLTTTQTPNQSGVLNDCASGDTPGLEFLATASCLNLDESRRSGSWFRSQEDHSQRLTVKSQATIFGGRFWGMDHQFKVGFSVENERYFRDRDDAPSMNYFVINTQGEDNGQGNEEEGSPETFGLAIARLSVPRQDDVRATGTNWGFYAEDQFRPTSNLTVTLGLRVDREELNAEGKEKMDLKGELKAIDDQLLLLPGLNEGILINENFTAFEGAQEYLTQLSSILCASADSDAAQACRVNLANGVAGRAQQLYNSRRNDNINIANTNFSPKLSVAWSPWANGKTAFRMAVGRNFNFIPLVVPLQELQPATTNVAYRIDLGSQTPSRLGSIQPTPSVSTISRDLKTPYQDELVLSVERELWAETSMKFSYIRRLFEDQLQDENINIGLGDYGQCVIQNSRLERPIEPTLGVGDRVDEYTGETYYDDDPGIGDGRDDDCVGDADQIDSDPLNDSSPGPGQPSDIYTRQRPDGLLDLYVQNPFWGDVYEVGNINSAQYTGYVMELTRRQYRNWEMQASYTYSETRGDGEDFFQAIGDDPSLRNNVKGYQSNDVRHSVKMNATTITPWGVRLGTAVSWQSGLPYSVLIQQPSDDAVPLTIQGVYSGAGLRARQQYRDASAVSATNPLGFVERNSGRNESYWNVDLKATKELTIGKNLNLQLSAEVFNVLNDDTFTVYNTNAEAGFQVNQIADGFYRFGRQWQVGMKIAF